MNRCGGRLSSVRLTGAIPLFLTRDVVTFAPAADGAVFLIQGVPMKKIAVAGLLTAMMGVASAQAYIGGVVGQSRINLSCEDFNLGCDKSDTGKKFYVGYKLNPVVGLEAAYVDFGKGTRGYTESYFDGFQSSDIDVNQSIEARGALLAAAFRYAAHPQLSLVGRVGLSILKTKGSSRSIVESFSTSDDSVKPYLGLGIEFALNKNVRITADADFTSAELNDSRGDLRLLGVGLQYGF